MKRIFCIIAILTSMISCSKDKSTWMNSPPEPPHTDFVASADWNKEFSNYIKAAQKVTLKFTSIEELETTVSELTGLSEIEIKEWYKKKGFVSQKMLYDNAVEELQILESKEDVEKYKKKYKHFFLFNEVLEDEDLSPYLPLSKQEYSYVCNVYGRVIINGIERNLNDLKSFEQTTYAYYIRNLGKTKADSQWDNYLYREYSDRKFWAESSRSNQEVKLHLTAHKKNWLGWHKYKTTYSFRMNAFNDNGCWEQKYDFLNKIISGRYSAELSSGYTYTLGRYVKKPILNQDDEHTGAYMYHPISLTIWIDTIGVIKGGPLKINYPNM